MDGSWADSGAASEGPVGQREAAPWANPWEFMSKFLVFKDHQLDQEFCQYWAVKRAPTDVRSSLIIVVLSLATSLKLTMHTENKQLTRHGRAAAVAEVVYQGLPALAYFVLGRQGYPAARERVMIAVRVARSALDFTFVSLQSRPSTLLVNGTRAQRASCCGPTIYSSPSAC